MAADPAPAITLELAVAPDGLGGLRQRLRGGLGRARPLRMVWHDRDGAARDAGLAVIAWQDGRRGGWRSEAVATRLACPARVLGAAVALVGLDVPAGLAPVAAIEGRVREGRLGEGRLGDVALRLVEAPGQARLWLDGPGAGALALDLAEWVRVPAVGLSAQMLGVAPPPGAPVLAAGMAPNAAFAGAMGHLMGVVLHHAPRALAGELGEPVHAMRVALRRMRALAGVFAPLFDGPGIAALRAALKTLAGAMGAARDWDVFLSGTGAAVAAAFPGPAMDSLLDAAGQRRAAAYAALRDVLDGPGLHRPALMAAILAQSLPHGDETTLEALAVRVLRRRARRLARLADGVQARPVAELHALRLRAKRLRYAAEAFAPLFPAPAAGRYLRRLAALQEALGLLNDGVVAESLMAELGADGLAGGLVRGYVAGAASGARTAVVAACARLAAAEPFWK